MDLWQVKSKKKQVDSEGESSEEAAHILRAFLFSPWIFFFTRLCPNGDKTQKSWVIQAKASHQSFKNWMKVIFHPQLNLRLRLMINAWRQPWSQPGKVLSWDKDLSHHSSLTLTLNGAAAQSKGFEHHIDGINTHRRQHKPVRKGI